MDYKKIITFFLLLFIFCFYVSADSISNYKVPNSVPLEKDLTIYGEYSGAPSTDVLCSFYIFDVNNTDFNQMITRLADEYTNGKGEFTSKPFKVYEPLLQRGIDYNAVTTCGTTTTSKVFHVSQKEEIIAGISSQSLINDFLFWTNPENSWATVFALFVILFVSVLAWAVWPF